MAFNGGQWSDLIMQGMQAALFQRFQQQQQMPFLPEFQQNQQDNNDDEDSCPEEKRTLFIANLDDTKVDDELLYELFLQAGPIEKVSFPKKKSFAFITYVHSSTPVYAMHLYQGVKLFNTPMVIKFQGTTNLPQLMRRLLPPDYGIARDCVAIAPQNPFSEPMRTQMRNFDNSALRNSRHAAFMDSEPNDRNYRRDRSPQRSRDRNSDNYRRRERSPTRRRQDKDSEKNWVHGPERGHSHSHRNSQPYEKRRF